MRTNLLMSCFFVCWLLYGDNKAIHQKKHITKTASYPSKHTEAAQETNVAVLIEGIETAGFTEGKNIYINWGEGYAFNCYQKLLELAPDTTWLRLGSSKNPVTRFYAYNALYKKHSSLAKLLKKKLLKDKTILYWRSCDVVIALSLGNFVAFLGK